MSAIALTLGSRRSPGRRGAPVTNDLPMRVAVVGLRGLLQRELIAQFVARELADRRPRQVVDEIERRGNFVLAELAGEENLEFFQRERNSAVAQFDKCLGRLAA